MVWHLKKPLLLPILVGKVKERKQKKSNSFLEGGNLIENKEAKELINALCNKNPSNRPKDGGESFAFFSSHRPWKDLINKQPVKIELGSVKKSDGKKKKKKEKSNE